MHPIINPNEAANSTVNPPFCNSSAADFISFIVSLISPVGNKNVIYPSTIAKMTVESNIINAKQKRAIIILFLLIGSNPYNLLYLFFSTTEKTGCTVICEAGTKSSGNET